MKIRLISGRYGDVKLPSPDAYPSSYFFSMVRSGSSLFWFIVLDLIKAAKNRSYCQPIEDLFAQGISGQEVDPEALRQLVIRPGYAFGMFRWFDAALHELRTAPNKKFLLVRDPRDVVVSFYYSMKNSHVLPARADGEARDVILQTRDAAFGPLCEFVQSPPVKYLAGIYDGYVEICRSARNLTVFRYEEVIYNKRAWALQLSDALELELPRRTIFRIADRYDQILQEERPQENIRQVRPGNFGRHLDDAAMLTIEQDFARGMAYFGYPPRGPVNATFTSLQDDFYRALGERFAAIEALQHDIASQLLLLRKPLRVLKQRANARTRAPALPDEGVREGEGSFSQVSSARHA